MNPRHRRAPVALVVNTHSAVRHALCDRIRTSFAHLQLREAATVQDALFVLAQTKVDIVLLEAEGSGVNGLKGTRAILKRAPQASVIVMSAYNDPACRSAASNAGAIAFVSKRAIGSELMDVLSHFTDEWQRNEDSTPCVS